jgi:hypothetical protein
LLKLVNGILQLYPLFWRQVIHSDIHDIMNIRHLESARLVLSGVPKSVLTQNQHLAPNTQQAERSWLNTRAGSEACQSISLKLTKDENELDKTWNLPGGTRQFRIYG